MDYPILSLITFLPLVGVAFIFFIRGEEEAIAKNIKLVALYTSLFTFGLSVFMFMNFDPNSPELQFVEYAPWFSDLNIAYHMGVDGLSIFFVLLSTLLWRLR